jgi:hypothetical protein
MGLPLLIFLPDLLFVPLPEQELSVPSGRASTVLNKITRYNQIRICMAYCLTGSFFFL